MPLAFVSTVFGVPTEPSRFTLLVIDVAPIIYRAHLPSRRLHRVDSDFWEMPRSGVSINNSEDNKVFQLESI